MTDPNRDRLKFTGDNESKEPFTPTEYAQHRERARYFDLYFAPLYRLAVMLKALPFYITVMGAAATAGGIIATFTGWIQWPW